MAKVSVILTSFNHEKYIKEAIDSVLAQTFEDFELIIWDDASSDKSWEIISSYGDDRIKSFRNESQKRGIYGINKAIAEIAAGEYIAIHHSDDVWESTKLEKQVAFLEANSEYGAVFTNAMAVNENGEPFEDRTHFYYSIFDQPNRTRHEWLNFFFYQGNALCHPSVMIRKECYDDCGLYRYGLAQLGDYDMWIRLCLKYEIFVLPEKLVRFRVRENEANSSGNHPTNRIRGITEHFVIARNFLQIQNWDDMLRVFPASIKYYDVSVELISEFVLAMMALENMAWRDTKLFGLTLLYELVNSHEKSQKIKELYGFDYLKLVEMAANNDVFAVDELYKLYNPERFIQLFIDDGSGITEENSIKLPVVNSYATQESIFDLSDKQPLHAIRLDPLNDSCVIEVEELKIVSDSGEVDIVGYIGANVCAHHGKSYFFETADPQMYFADLPQDILSGAKKLVVMIRYVHIGRDAVHACANQIMIDKNYQAEQQTQTIEQQTQTIEQQTQTIEQQTQTIEQQTQTIEQQTQTIEQQTQTIEQQTQTIEQQTQTIEQQTQTIEQLVAKNISLENEVIKYAMSRSWALTRPLRVLMRLLSSIVKNQ